MDDGRGLLRCDDADELRESGLEVVEARPLKRVLGAQCVIVGSQRGVVGLERDDVGRWTGGRQSGGLTRLERREAVFECVDPLLLRITTALRGEAIALHASGLARVALGGRKLLSPLARRGRRRGRGEGVVEVGRGCALGAALRHREPPKLLSGWLDEWTRQLRRLRVQSVDVAVA